MRKRIERFIEVILLIVLAGLAVVFLLADQLGLFERIADGFMADFGPQSLIWMISLIAGGVIVVILRINTFHETDERTMAAIEAESKAQGVAIEAALEKVDTAVAENAYEVVAARMEHQPERVRQILNPEIGELARNIRQLRDGDTFTIIGRDSFQQFWSRTIRNAGDSLIRATAHPDPNYFFDPTKGDIQSAIRAHKKAGGRMRRTFFCTREQLASPDFQRTLADQQAAGVDVRVCDAQDVAPRLVRYILVDDTHRKFGWELLVRGNSLITECHVALTERAVDRLADALDEIESQDCVHDFDGNEAE